MTTITDWDTFAANASPEAIHTELAKARNRRRETDRTINRLEELLVRRTKEVAAGFWPPKGES